MRQQPFEAEHAPLWDALTAWLRGEPTLGAEDVPAAYRRLCHHVALAKERRYSVPLSDRLQRLALNVHQRLYAEGEGGLGLWRFIARDFPRLVRSEWRLTLFAMVLLFGSWAWAFLLVRHKPDLVYLLIGPAQAAEIARMYDPAATSVAGQTGPLRDMTMFGYYIWNNIGIDFQIFASGFLCGITPIFMLLLNGLFGGAVMAHLTNLGFVSTFYGFVSGHSSFELVGAAISGAAGLRLGLAIIHPGRHSRLEALKASGRKGAHLVMGAAMLTFIAACLEGFWSANQLVSWKVKVVVGTVFWVLLALYLLLAGRERVRP